MFTRNQKLHVVVLRELAYGRLEELDQFRSITTALKYIHELLRTRPDIQTSELRVYEYEGSNIWRVNRVSAYARNPISKHVSIPQQLTLGL